VRPENTNSSLQGASSAGLRVGPQPGLSSVLLPEASSSFAGLRVGPQPRQPGPASVSQPEAGSSQAACAKLEIWLLLFQVRGQQMMIWYFHSTVRNPS